ncbi:MAG: rhodanese-like domain-containing protein [Magnetococcales bacterium]|nr:rhodanese-like domain-containing protein [Magnetococcales bacterium]
MGLSNYFKKKAQITSKQLIKEVAERRIPRLIDLRGDYTVAIPGSIPVQWDVEIFYEDVQWIQDMLGAQFRSDQPIVIVCEFGRMGMEALDYFWDKNTNSPYTLRSLKGGMYDYRQSVDKLTAGFRRQQQFTQELTSLTTPPDRFHRLAKGLFENKKSMLGRVFG